ncbi:hypothetical protein QC761_0072290 [Podospora bellae-mahoneyi]|uniref:Uncharacterized protein n=1 Tax=Podospora bellae-mahoneyi TaxID=2093777 RepID=A0ABR0FJ87_9PEZI|nr:hypothetical protein QC761_0072290 [Podospora bellae-mahoneyi]
MPTCILAAAGEWVRRGRIGRLGCQNCRAFALIPHHQLSHAPICCAVSASGKPTSASSLAFPAVDLPKTPPVTSRTRFASVSHRIAGRCRSSATHKMVWDIFLPLYSSWFRGC